nr:MAG TPA: hypothetical protein [Caudoviricetes sp.]
MYSSANFCCFKVNFANFPPPFLTNKKRQSLNCLRIIYGK